MTRAHTHARRLSENSPSSKSCVRITLPILKALPCSLVICLGSLVEDEGMDWLVGEERGGGCSQGTQGQGLREGWWGSGGRGRGGKGGLMIKYHLLRDAEKWSAVLLELESGLQKEIKVVVYLSKPPHHQETSE